MEDFMWIISSTLYAFFFSILLFIARILQVRQTKTKPDKNSLKITFVHLDLGVGGAERLVVDSACALQSKNHKIVIYTTNHPKDHCFPETLNQLKVVVHGAFIPHHLFGGRFQTVCSSLRMGWLAWKVILFSSEKPDVIFCDGVSTCIPILKLGGSKILFYCHHPDQLLTRKKSLLRSIYRYPLDVIEEITTGMADQILVNSKYTGTVFRKTFTHLVNKKKILPLVVYPCINTITLDELLNKPETLPLVKKKKIFLSLNRFDPAKKVEVAVEAFLETAERIPEERDKLQLIVAGGYDHTVQANVNYLRKLEELVQKYQLKSVTMTKDKYHNTALWAESSVIFLPDITDQHKMELLKNCLGLIYTPSFEHFGIVPVESMFARCPVIAVNNGGLLESVTEDQQNGILCPPGDIESFSRAMEVFVRDPKRAKCMGDNGRKRAIENFSLEKLTHNLDEIVKELVGRDEKQKKKQ